jgi:phosphoglycolate phosphatase-like HAD superfamily hydrolase
VSGAARPVALDLDGVLGDTRSLWVAWLEAAGDVLGVRASELAEDRADAACELDARGAGNWRDLLGRFAEERVAVYVRREATTGEALRDLAARGVAIGVFTDAPAPLARVALTHLGADRRVTLLETGAGALDRLLDRLGPETVVLRTRDELRAAMTAM